MGPEVTVITVVFNGREKIGGTITSVASQRGINVEHVVIDGGSTDGTVEAIEKHAGDIAFWTSEPDRGIYDAMNKGLAHAKGEWVLFLGCGDAFASSDVVAECMQAARQHSLGRQHPALALIFGDVRYDTGLVFRSSMSWRLLLRNTIHHQGAFYHRSLFDSFRYNVEHRLMADYELNLLIYRRRLPVLKLDRIISICEAGGRSAVLSNRWRSIDELNAIRKQYVAPPINLFMSSVLFAKTVVRMNVLRSR